MEPVNLELQKGIYHITHRCQSCGAIARCKTAPEDSIKALAELAEAIAKKMFF